MTSPVDEIRHRLDIVDVISAYIKLQKAGRNYKAPCPFHNEKDPSFMVSPERQNWRCFGCNRSGSIFDFIMEIENVEFGDALRILAQRAGVELKKVNPELAKQIKTERSLLYEISTLANKFFIKQLEASQTGRCMQKYLLSRGLTKKTIADWQIGFAPGSANSWRALKDFLNSRGYQDKDIVKSGLAVKSESKNVYYDRFRDRIMFPITDVNGLVVGFTGRENPDHPVENMGKYINTPSTLIYDKSRILYGLDRAKLAIREAKSCILVEGQTDVIMAHQAGFTNVVAGSGTALTSFQLKIIKRYTDNLNMAYDMDSAGEMATKRGIDLALEAGFNIGVISLPDNQDPADYIFQNKAGWVKSVSQAQNLMDFYIGTAFKKHDSSTAIGKKNISSELLPVIKKIPNSIEQTHWLQQISTKLRVSEAVLTDEMKKIKIFTANTTAPAESVMRGIDQRSGSALEEYALGLVLANPDSIGKCRKINTCLFASQPLADIFSAIKKAKTKKINVNFVKKKFPEAHGRIDDLIFKAEALQEKTVDLEVNKEIDICFAELKRRHLKKELADLALAIKQAEQSKQGDNLAKLINNFNKLSKQLTSL